MNRANGSVAQGACLDPVVAEYGSALTHALPQREEAV